MNSENLLIENQNEAENNCLSQSELTSTFLSQETQSSSEEDQEILVMSLISLTSHFSQVQFRLSQIIEAPQSKRDDLLQQLEKFASLGAPEIIKNLKLPLLQNVMARLEDLHEDQCNLINLLKKQIFKLETLLRESEETIASQAILLKEQEITIEDLNRKIAELKKFEKILLCFLKNDGNRCIVDEEYLQECAENERNENIAENSNERFKFVNSANLGLKKFFKIFTGMRVTNEF